MGTRPQFIKAGIVSEKINFYQQFEEIIINTGQHFERNMSKIFFSEMKIADPSYDLNVNNMEYAQMVGKMTLKLNLVLEKEKVDGVLVYGDTNSTLAGSLAAKKLNLPIFHVEAGLRSYDRKMLEENNRIITDHLSSLLFCPTKSAIRNLKDENISTGISFTGDVMYDSYLKFISTIKNDIKTNISSNYILCTLHRRENITSKSKLSSIFRSLDAINDKIKIIMPLHPHTRKKMKEFKISTKITLFEPLSYMEMLLLIRNCDLVITDSGGLQKESFFAKKKSLIIRNSTEWFELIEGGFSLLCNSKNLNRNFSKLTEHKCNFSKELYGSGKASNHIVNSITKFLS